MPDPVTMREFDDVAAMRQAIHTNLLAALRTRFPMENAKHILELKDVDFKNYKDFDSKAQRRAIMRNETLANNIHGTWTLRDKITGQEIESKTGNVMAVPWMTPRGTFIHAGNEYTTSSQLRLKPGVYSRVRENGELESHFNTKSGTGPQFRVWMEPETGIFRMRFQQANLKLYPILRALGYDDEGLQQAWGNDILTTNRESPEQDAVKKLYTKLAGTRADPHASDTMQIEAIREKMEKSLLDPDVTERTLGKRYDHVEPASIVDATQKLLRLNRGEDAVDNRDSLQYRTLHSVEDFAAERVKKDAAMLARNLLWKASYQKSLKPIGTAALSPYMTGLLVGNSLSQPLEEINPLHILEQHHRIISTGEGAIQNKEAIPDEAHTVQPSQLGFMDLVAGPENLNIGVDVRAAYGTRKGSDNNIYSPVKNNRTGKIEYVNPSQISHASLAFE